MEANNTQSATSTMNTATPNIFSYATSELSQDAFFCWLMAWADPSQAENDSELHEAGKAFVRLVCGDPSLDIRSIEFGRQWNHIDVWAEINDDLFLIIEDKTYTCEHSKQLARYRDESEHYYKGSRKIIGAYVKTGNESLSSLAALERKSGYRIVERHDILQAIGNYSGSNQIMCDYLRHLKGIERDTNSFASYVPQKWSWNAWQGFYRAIQKELDAEWDYVANPNGGFLGMWWCFTNLLEDNAQIYLQIEQGDLCFKVDSGGKDNPSAIRNKYYRKLMKICKDSHPEIAKPTRFGSGRWMTIAKVSMEDYLGNQVIDLTKVLAKIREYETLIDKCAQLQA